MAKLIKKCLLSLAIGEIPDKPQYHYRLTRTVKINQTGYIKCYQGCRATRTFIH